MLQLGLTALDQEEKGEKLLNHAQISGGLELLLTGKKYFFLEILKK